MKKYSLPKITKKIDSENCRKNDPETIKNLFVKGFDFSQIHFLTGASMETIKDSLSLEDLFQRIENAKEIEESDYPLLVAITGIGWGK